MLIAIPNLILIISLNPPLQRIFARNKKKKLNGAGTSVSSRQIKSTYETSNLTSSQQVTTTSLNVQKAIEEAQAARQRYERIGELRHLDIQIAEAFMFYVSIQWGRNYFHPTGIPRTDYDHHHPGDNQFRETIPHYSTNQSDYSILERSAVGSGFHDLFLQILAEGELDETSATLEQKCITWLKARTEERKRRTNRGD